MIDYTGLEIAIIGMSGRFPGAGDIGSYWDNLRKGVESVEFFSKAELASAGQPSSLIDDPLYVRANSYVSGKENFDASFFGYLPSEAALMDPQMRLFHQVCWHALEDAGCNPYAGSDKIGLFAGATSNVNWEVYASLVNQEEDVDDFSAYQLSNIRFLTTKIAYAFNLRGLAMFIDTACSTSMVAVHQACRSLLVGDCSIAMAGGVTITNESKRGYVYKEGMIHSSDGHCRAFDAQASGTVGGEGAGAVVLKKLKNAWKDGDHIYAVIRGTGINNDGNNKVGYTAPSIEGQMEAIITAHKWSKIDPVTIGYVEAHGTGTRLGDPVEIAGLTRAFNTGKRQFCAIGSVKTNIGHLDTAAGVAGLIKAVLSLYHKQLVPSLHYRHGNPEIDFANSPFYVNTELRDWVSTGGNPLRAGVSSFGIGGTNVHVVLEEAPLREAGTGGRSHQLLVVSAKTAGALERNCSALVNYLENNPGTDLRDISYTLQKGRAPLAYRRSVVCKDTQEARQLLGSAAPQLRSAVSDNRTPRVVFMFSGQGSQYVNMCRGLYESEASFRATVEACFSIVESTHHKDLRSVLLPDPLAANHTLIDTTAYTQPCLFIVEYALSRLLMSWGVQPAMLIGHSIGEYVAACISGVFSLEDALQLVVKRGELMQGAEPGKMLSVSLSSDELMPMLSAYEGLLSLAAVNSPGCCVVSGGSDAIDEFSASLESAGRRCRLLRTSHAFHSWMMDGLLNDFREAFSAIKFGTPQIPFISNVTGRAAVATEVMGADYWVNHLRGCVRFSEGISGLLESPNILFVELGPGKVLSSLVESNKKRTDSQVVVNTVRSAAEGGEDMYHLLSCVGALWVGGVVMDWDAYYINERRLKVPLPGYSFEQVAYPVDVDAYKLLQSRMGKGLAKVDTQDVSNWFYVPGWKRSLLSGGKAAEAVKSLVFMDSHGIALRLCQRLELLGQQVIMVEAGQSFSSEGANHYCIDAHSTADYDRLFSLLSSSGDLPERIIHMWPVNAAPSSEEQATATGINSPEYGLYYYSLAEMVKSLQKHRPALCKSIVLVSSGLHQGEAAAQDACLKSMGEGLLKVIGQEYPGLSCSHIDISLSQDIEQLTEGLLRELSQAGRGEVVSLRKGERWLEVYDRLAIGAASGGRSFREGGVYVISGGLGNLGYHVSKYLLSRYKARLLLLGRTSLDDHTASVKRDRKAELDLLGGEVLYVQCDVCDKQEFSQALLYGEQELGAVNGVIHAAGVVEGGSINLLGGLGPADFREQFGCKVSGLEVLSDVLGERELDFCVLTSSLSSVLGGLGFGAYAPANKYMDEYVRAGLAAGRLGNWVSVNLDGLDFEHSVHASEITVSELCEVIERVLSNKDLGRIIVSKTDLYPRLGAWITGSIEQQQPGAEKDGEGSLQEADLQSATGLTGHLQSMWQSFFGLDVIDKGADFFELGGDSLKALTMLSRIYKAFNADISIKDFYDHSTVEALGVLLFSRKQAEAVPISYASIGTAAFCDRYVLSSAQRRLYFLYEFDHSSLAYNMPYAIRMEGLLDEDLLEDSFRALLDRHEILRTRFELWQGAVWQRVEEDIAFGVTLYESEESGISKIVEDFVRPFDLHHCPLLRVGLIGVSDELHVLLIDMHHIVTDGVSTDILIRDFMSLYTGSALKPLRIRYKDYAVWQQGAEQQERISGQQAFWQQLYADMPEALQLPYDHARPALRRTQGAMLQGAFSPELTKGLRNLSARSGVSMFMVVLSLYHVLLSKLSGQEDIVIGTPTAGRSHADLEDVMGMFVNTLALRNQSDGEQSFLDFMLQVRSRSLSCFDQQDYQYEDLIDMLGIVRDMSRNPLFDVMLSYENFGERDLSLPNLNVSSYERRHTVSKFDLTLIVSEGAQELYVNIEYSTALFTSDTVARFWKYLERLAEIVSKDASVVLKDISVIDDAERMQLLEAYNDTTVPYPSDKTIIDLFEQQVLLTPDHIALECEEEHLNYRSLKEDSDKLALYLAKERGVKPGDFVGILMDRNMSLVVALLGVLKSGAAYIPIDPVYPEDRIRSIIEDAGISVMITGNEFAASPFLMGIGLVNMDSEWKQVSYLSLTPLRNKPQSNDLAYVIYTSGSTGKPKGVMIEHGSLVNYINWGSHHYIHQQGETIFSLHSSISFDLTVTSVFLPLICGNTIKIYGEQGSGILVEKVLRDEKVNVIKLTPSHLKIINEMSLPPAIATGKRKFIVGGEDLEMCLSASIYDKFGGAAEIYNEYGPTEATVGCMLYKYQPGETGFSMPIGSPIWNTQLYVLDKYMQVVPVGVAGELYIGGKGLSRGYLHNASLTAVRFVPNPFNRRERLYKTGDQARMLSTGKIVYLGRVDEQVKLRGFRIELGEIEYVLSTHEQVQQSAVVVKERRSGNKYLVGYYVSNEAIPETTLMDHLSHSLPEYMIPAYYVHLAAFPLTVNGKLNKKALPEPNIKARNLYTPPNNETEKQLVEIWAEILELLKEQISVEANFFDLGGNSLLAMTLANSIRTNMNLEFTLKEIFDKPTIRQFSNLIEISLWFQNDSQLQDEERVDIVI